MSEASFVAERSTPKLSFSSLVDASRYVQHYEELLGEIERTKEQISHRTDDLARLTAQISRDISLFAESIGQEYIDELSRQIVGFASTAVDQMKTKLADRLKREMDESISLADSERTKCVKSIESFLSTSPFRIHDKSMSLKLVDGAYGARARYRCEEEVEYEFGLDAKTSTLFGRELRLYDHLRTEVRIPVRIVKSWHKREPITQFERLDRYSLTEAESTEGSLTTVFSDQDGGIKIRVIYSRSEGASPFLAVEFITAGSTVNVTSEPALNNKLDSSTLSAIMDRTWTSVKELERHKIGLVRLDSGDRDVLGRYVFALKAVQILEVPIHHTLDTLTIASKRSVYAFEV